MNVMKFVGTIERLLEEKKILAAWAVYYQNWKDMPMNIAGMARTTILSHMEGNMKVREAARKVFHALFRKEG